MTTPTTPNGHGSKVSLRHLLEIGMKVAGPIALFLMGVFTTLAFQVDRRLDEHDVSLAVMTNTRFTAREGAELRAEMGAFITREELVSILEPIRLDLREIRNAVTIAR